MSDQENPALPVLRAHAAAVMRVGKEAADAVLKKFGGRGSPGGYRAVPEAKMAACIAELERLAGGPANTAESTERGLKRLTPAAMANFGTTKPKPPRTPKSLDDLAKPAWDRFNRSPSEHSK
ncbi:hypothetical protein [Bradyrhizobium cosmicum]|uniref:Uncharacterized protein n=1 Tax=Bradyrhizobium cosmicum TaxID=1404864 RepID=A0AAI8M8E9_9BRAD|nr:hypothetical protein [Bradyrhizobium cosmicum]BAL73746.1 hypothetical protein S23_05250 [Bradyrhizobium cosmicum]